ncbi:MAG: hypothetical protein ABH824_05930 [Nanoarchaeota archaeon]
MDISEKLDSAAEMVACIDTSVAYIQAHADPFTKKRATELHGEGPILDRFERDGEEYAEQFFGNFGTTLQLCYDLASRDENVPEELYYAVSQFGEQAANINPQDIYSLLERGVEKFPESVLLNYAIAQQSFLQLQKARRSASWEKALELSKTATQHAQKVKSLNPSYKTDLIGNIIKMSLGFGTEASMRLGKDPIDLIRSLRS